jgi:hypothetical protein
MKVLFLVVYIPFFATSLLAQTSLTYTKVIIVSCKTGDLYIDGSLIGKIEADDARQQSLSSGEHYLQVKTASDKFNLATKIDQNTKNIIKIGCEIAPQSTTETPKPTLLIDKQLSLGGTLSNEVQQNILALDEGDNILLSCTVLNKRGSANISIKEYFSASEIFRNEGFNSIDLQKIAVPRKGIYIFNVTTNALFGRDIKLAVARIPSPAGNPNFKTSVRRYYDTAHEEVLTTDAVVHSTSNNSGNKTTIKINLPINTTYWTYWIGVGQDANKRMKDFISNLSAAAKFVSSDPLVLFGLKVIPSLPIFNSTATINYRFMDSRNAELFMQNRPCQPYNFKFADNIASDFSNISSNQKDLVLAMWNPSAFNGQNVNIHVVAFSVRMKLAMEE